MLVTDNNLGSDAQNFWRKYRFIVTGGAGFLGSWVIDVLRARGATEIFVPRREKYDLCEVAGIREMLNEVCPGRTAAADFVVIRLAATVGGIVANYERPAEFFYNNSVMGMQLLHESWRAGVGKFVTVGTVCAYPKLTPVPFCENSLWDGYPEKNERTVRNGQKDVVSARRGVSTTVRI